MNMIQPAAGMEISPAEAEPQYQVPMTVEQSAQKAEAIVESETWQKLEDSAESVRYPTAKLMSGWFKILDSIAKRRDIDIHHPLMNEAERRIALLWFSHRIGMDSQDIYKVVGEAGQYSEVHRRCVRSLPVDLEPEFSNLVRFPGAGSIPVQEVDNEEFSAEKEWISHDRKKREELAQEVATFASEKIEEIGVEGKGIILDIAGGNGELSNLIAQAKDLPAGALIVIRELNPGMIEEGRRKIANLGLSHKVKFIEGDAQESFDTQREQLSEILPEYKDAPVIAAVSTYTAGAMPKGIAENVFAQACEDLAKGGMFINCDFAAQPTPELRGEYEEQTGKAGEAFDKSRRLLAPGLQICYDNWGHDVQNLERVSKRLEERGAEIKNEWEITTFTMLPLYVGKEKTHCAVIPGYIQRTLKGVKK